MAGYNDDFFSPSSLRFNTGFGSAIFSKDNDRLEEALANLTTESYSAIYGVIDDIQSAVETT